MGNGKVTFNFHLLITIFMIRADLTHAQALYVYRLTVYIVYTWQR